MNKQQQLKESMEEFSTKLAHTITCEMSEFMTKHWELMLQIWVKEMKHKLNKGDNKMEDTEEAKEEETKEEETEEKEETSD